MAAPSFLLQEHQVCRFTSDRHEWFQEGTDSGVCITTFTMIAYSGKRSAESERIMQVGGEATLSSCV